MWTPVAENLPSAILSIRGTSSTDVWAVGADNGSGPAVMHYDGNAWSSLSTGTSGDIWWTETVGDTVWLVGAGGQILSYQDGAFTTQVVDETVTFYGVWGSGTTLWAVGGRPELGANGGMIYQNEGRGWVAATLPPEASATLAIFKIWGSSATDVWAVGSEGILLHYDGSTWTLVPTGLSDESLFTVSGAGGVSYAVGGFSSGVILRNDGSGWVSDATGMVPQMNGVYAISAEEALAVGNQGSIWIRDADGWTEDTRKETVYQDFHAAWADETGGLWASGGHLSSRPLDGGMLYYLGSNPPSSP